MDNVPLKKKIHPYRWVLDISIVLVSVLFVPICIYVMSSK
jgi:hypothetical protein